MLNSAVRPTPEHDQVTATTATRRKRRIMSTAVGDSLRVATDLSRAVVLAERRSLLAGLGLPGAPPGADGLREYGHAIVSSRGRTRTSRKSSHA